MRRATRLLRPPSRAASKGRLAFIAHPVSRACYARGYDEEVVAAALLHDVVEDTRHLNEVRQQSGAWRSSSPA